MKETRSFSLITLLLILISLSGCRSLTTLYFHPSNEYFNDPAEHGISYETVVLEPQAGIRLSNWLFHAEGELKGRVVFFHGNAENISTHFASVHWLPKSGYEVLLVDYRGFGKSSGVPVLPDVLLDMIVSYEWMQQRSLEDGKPIFVLAQSIGSALSVMALAELESQPDCVALDAGFGSFQDMARISFQRSWLFWPFAYPASWLLPSDLEPKDYASELEMPILQFHSPNDQVIPYDEGRALMSKFRNVIWAESSGPHIATFNFKKYRTALLDFYQECHF